MDIIITHILKISLQFTQSKIRPATNKVTRKYK